MCQLCNSNRPERSADKALFFTWSALAGGNVISLLLRMVGGILQAKCVLPAVLGLYNSINLVLGYAPFLQLGILNGINRELPYYVGKGDRQRVNELAAAAQAWALAVGGIVRHRSVGRRMLAIGPWPMAIGCRLVHQRRFGRFALLQHQLSADDVSHFP